MTHLRSLGLTTVLLSRQHFSLRTSPSGCAPVASSAAIDFLGAEEVGAASAPSGRRNRGGRQRTRGGGGGGGRGGAGVVGVAGVAGVAEEVGVVVVVKLAGVVALVRRLVELRLMKQQVKVAVRGVDCSSRVGRRIPYRQFV
ncbi:unnamed protein product [Closterium sp. Naga37s-1]|nr:unnamed protein product [Closterium sp. Naga37s-1]